VYMWMFHVVFEMVSNCVVCMVILEMCLVGLLSWCMYKSMYYVVMYLVGTSIGRCYIFEREI